MAVEALMAHLGHERFYMAGNSLGGGIAWYYSIKHPEQVIRQILIAPSGIKLDTDTDPLAFKLAKSRILSPFVRWLTPKGLVESSLQEVYFNTQKVDTTLVNRYFDLQLHEGNREAFIDRLRQNFFEGGRPSLTEVSVPTLLMWGAHDRWVVPEKAPLFQDSIRGSELITYPHAGHVPMEEIPNLTVMDALEFLVEEE